MTHTFFPIAKASLPGDFLFLFPSNMIQTFKNRSVHIFGDMNKIAVQEYMSAILAWGTVTVPTFQIDA